MGTHPCRWIQGDRIAEKMLLTFAETEHLVFRRTRGRGDKGAGTGRSASRGGSDPRDAEVQALRKQLAELAELMDLRAQEAADLPLAAATPVRSEKGRKTIVEALGAQAVGRHDARSPASCSGHSNGH